MKRRVRKIANFFAFNLLFFALYLNFIHKDRMVLPVDESDKPKTAAFSGTVLVENPEQYLQKKYHSTNSVADQKEIALKTKEETSTPLKFSVN